MWVRVIVGHSAALSRHSTPSCILKHVTDHDIKSETLAEVSPHAEPFGSGTQFHLLIIRHTEAFNQHSIIIPTYTAETYSLPIC